MARSVRDIAILLTSMAGHDPADNASVLRPAEDYERDLNKGIEGIRVGVETSYLTAVMSPGVRTAFDNALARLTSLGAEIVNISIPAMRASLGALTAIMFAEALDLHGAPLTRRPMDYGRDVRLSLLAGRLYTAVDYVEAQRFRTVLTTRVDDVLGSKVDVLATPTVVMEPPAWGEAPNVINGVAYDSLNAFIRCTSPFNLTGHPALSVPCGRGELGLPVGLQLVGGCFQERTLLQVGQAFEQSGSSTTHGR